MGLVELFKFFDNYHLAKLLHPPAQKIGKILAPPQTNGESWVYPYQKPPPHHLPPPSNVC